MNHLSGSASGNRKKRGRMYAPVAVIIICIAIIFAMSVFFRVSNITVTGNNIYTAQEVMDAAGIENGDNLFFINRFAAVSRIYSRLPYIESASITRQLPNKVNIDVTDCISIAYITLEGGDCWAIDRNCKLLNLLKPGETGDLISIEGITTVDPAIGETISPGPENLPKVEYLAEILYQIQERNMMDDISRIDISSAASPSFDYLSRFNVVLGPKTDTEYKFGMLMSAVQLLAEGDTGTIDLSLSSDNKAHFSPG